MAMETMFLAHTTVGPLVVEEFTDDGLVDRWDAEDGVSVRAYVAGALPGYQQTVRVMVVNRDEDDGERRVSAIMTPESARKLAIALLQLAEDAS